MEVQGYDVEYDIIHQNNKRSILEENGIVVPKGQNTLKFSFLSKTKLRQKRIQ